MGETERQTGIVRDSPKTTQWLAGIAAAFGLWMAVSPFVYGVGEALLWNNVIVGLAILIVAGYNAYRPSQGEMPHVSLAWLVAILGLWMIVAPLIVA